MTTIWAALAVFMGGGLGSLCRFGLSKLVVQIGFENTKFPLATFFSNISACLVMVAALYYFDKTKMASEATLLFWLVGFCGGFSTFSTFSYENWLLLKQGFIGVAAINVAVSILFCLAIFWFAYKRTI